MSFGRPVGEQGAGPMAGFPLPSNVPVDRRRSS
jgi:hypothetical protein